MTQKPLTRLIDREEELAALNATLKGSSSARGSAFILVYGRRRIGKSTLLEAWAQRSGLPFTHWQADRDLSARQRRDFMRTFLALGPDDDAPTPDSWAALWLLVARQIDDQKHIIIIDELPYAAAVDEAFLSALQKAWDQYFSRANVILVVCGSHVRMMHGLLAEASELHGRFTSRIELTPLPYAKLKAFFPKWSVEERVAGYAIVGGVPEYYEWLEPKLSLQENIAQRIISRYSMFLAEPSLILVDQMQQPTSHQSIIRAIGEGHHAFDEIRLDSEGAANKLSAYLGRLEDLRLIERRLSAFAAPGKGDFTRDARYHLCDPFLRFYYRFVWPHAKNSTGRYEPERVLRDVREHLRAFVGQTIFQELGREWVWQAGQRGELPFEPRAVGKHWSSRVEIDVVAIDRPARQLLLGECKWTGDAIDMPILRDLLERKTAAALQDLARTFGPKDDITQWTIHHMLFSRAGFTPAVRAEMRRRGVIGVDLAQLDVGLR